MCPVSKKEDSGGFLCETIHSFLVLLAGDFEFSSRQLSHLKEKRGRGKDFGVPFFSRMEFLGFLESLSHFDLDLIDCTLGLSDTYMLFNSTHIENVIEVI